MKNSYPFSFMSNDARLFGNDNYHIKYGENMFDYKYHDKPVFKVLKKKKKDITKIYTFTFKTFDTNMRLIIFIIFLIISMTMILSLILIFIKKI